MPQYLAPDDHTGQRHGAGPDLPYASFGQDPAVSAAPPAPTAPSAPVAPHQGGTTANGTANATTFRPTALGWVAVGLLGLGLIRQMASNTAPLYVPTQDGVSILPVVFMVLSAVGLVFSVAMAVVGLLGFFRSGRRDLVAFGLGAVGTVDVVYWIVATVGAAIVSAVR